MRTSTPPTGGGRKVVFVLGILGLLFSWRVAPVRTQVRYEWVSVPARAFVNTSQMYGGALSVT